MSKVKFNKWLNLENNLVGLSVVKDNKNKPFLVFVVDLPKKGAGLPDFMKKAILFTGRQAVKLSPNIAVFGLQVGANFVEDMGKLYSTFKEEKNLNKPPQELIKEAFKTKYPTSYAFWKKNLINPAFSSLLIGALSNLTGTDKIIGNDTASKKVKEYLVDGLRNISLNLEMSPLSYSKYENISSLKRRITNELKQL